MVKTISPTTEVPKDIYIRQKTRNVGSLKNSLSLKNSSKKLINKLVDTQKRLSRNVPKEKPKGKLNGSFEIFQIVLQNLLDSVDQKHLISKFSLAKSIDEVQTFHNNLITHNGIEFGTKRYKDTCVYCVQMLEGNLNPEVPGRTSVGLKDRWPNNLGSLRPLFHQVRDNGPYRKVGDQVIRSLFAMQRIVEDFSEIALSDIEGKRKVDETFLSEYETFVESLYQQCPVYMNMYKVTPPLSLSSNGPNGLPKDKSAPLEAFLLTRDKQLWKHFEQISLLTKNKKFLEFVKKVSNEFESNVKGYDPKTNRIILKDKSHWTSPDGSENIVRGSLRKLTSIPDAGNKSRTIAICDYWTQCLLTPFEYHILQIINQMYPDGSNIFDHTGGFERLAKSIKPGIYSNDASSWTDTFSTDFQKVHIKHLYGSEFASSWGSLVVHCKWRVGSTNKFITYGTGQGMGTKGSFAIASLSYLSLMEFLMRKHYKELMPDSLSDRKFEGLFNQIGDDSWNYDPKGLVLKDMIEKGNIPFNLRKSKIATDNNLVGEFVSRNINYGNDVSRISLSLCRKVGENIFYLSSLVKHLHERTSQFNWDGLIKELRVLKKPNGKPHFPDHIWFGLLGALVIDDIICEDKIFEPLANALTRMLDNDRDKTLLLSLSTKFRTGALRHHYRLMLILQDCEYMYSKILESTNSSKDYLKEFPPFTYSKIYMNSIWDENALPFKYLDHDGLKVLTKLTAVVKTKELLEPELFKLSLGDSSLSDSSLVDLIDASLLLQRELERISKNTIFGKSFAEERRAPKFRVDRSYNIFKVYLKENYSSDIVIEKYLNYLPNLSVLAELPPIIYDQMVMVMENSYPLGEKIEDSMKVSKGEYTDKDLP